MALDSSNVRVAVTGAVSVAPVGSTAPTDGDTALAAAFKDLGYVSEDGITETRDRTSTTTRAWQNADIVRETVTEANLTFSLTLIETNADTVELYYGAAPDSDGSIVVVPSLTGGRRAFVFDVVDGDEFIRIYVPQGEVTEVGDVVYSSGEPIGYEVTIRAYSDATLVDANGNTGTARKWFSSLAAA